MHGLKQLGQSCWVEFLEWWRIKTRGVPAIGWRAKEIMGKTHEDVYGKVASSAKIRLNGDRLMKV
jgi:hypothetical protein